MAIAGAPASAPSSAPVRSAPTAPRGVRNQNQGNLKDGPFARSQPGYVGAAGSGNMRFAVFDTPEAGNRAQETLLTNNYLARGFTTPAAIVNRYAPPGPENTPESVQNYTNYVAGKLGIGPNDNVSPDQVATLAQAMREFENGQTSGGVAAPAASDLEALSTEDLMALAEGDETAQQTAFTPDRVISETLAPGVPPDSFQGGTPEFDPSVPFMANPTLQPGTREEGRNGRSDEELRAQGYKQNANGTWRFAPSPEQLQAMGYSWDPEANSWVSHVPDEYVTARNASRDVLNEQDTGLQERIRALSNGGSFGLSLELEKALVEAQQRGENFNSTILGEEIPYSAGTYGDAYYDEATARQNRFREDRPGQSLGFELAGSLLTPGAAQAAGFIGRGANNAVRTARASGVSAGAGLLAGQGNAEGSFAERLPEAGQGALIGAGAGAVIQGGAPVVSGLLNRAGSGLAEAGATIQRGVGIQPAEAVIGARETNRAIEYVRRLADSSGAGDLAANPILARGKPVTAAEAIGPSGVSNMAALTRRSGRAGLLAQTQLGARAQERSQRIVQDFADLTGMDPAGSADMIQNLARTGRAKATPLYEAAYARPGAVRSETLDALLERPSVRRALNNAADIAREEGRDPTTMGFDFDAAGDVIHVREPSMQTLDYIKRGLDDVLEGYRDSTTRKLNLDTRGRAVNDTAREFRQELINLNPAYGEALQAGGDPIRLEQAFGQAGRLFQTGTNQRTFNAAIARMSQSDRDALVAGFADKLFNDAQAGRLRPADLRLPVTRAKLTTLLGEEGAASFTQRIDDEIALSASGNRMAPGSNSVTAEALAAMAEQDQPVGLLSDLSRNIENRGVWGGTVETGIRAISAPVAGFVRGIQAPAPQGVRDEIGRLLMMAPDELSGLLAMPVETTQGAGLLAPRIAPAQGGLLSGGAATSAPQSAAPNSRPAARRAQR